MNNYFTSLSSNELVLLETIKTDFFSKSNKIEPTKTEGYKVYNDKIQIGYRIGPTESISDGLFHEMGHILDTTNFKRLLQYGFGLEIKTSIEILGRLYYEPTTWNATKLECRCIVWQELLCKKYNLPFDTTDFSKSLQYLPDWYNVPTKDHYYKDGDYYNSNNEKVELSLKQKDNLRYETINNFINLEKQKEFYNFTELENRWNERINFINANYK